MDLVRKVLEAVADSKRVVAEVFPEEPPSAVHIPIIEVHVSILAEIETFRLYRFEIERNDPVRLRALCEHRLRTVLECIKARHLRELAALTMEEKTVT